MKTKHKVGRLFIASVILALLFSPLAVSGNSTTAQSFTHTVFAEFGTATS